MALSSLTQLKGFELGGLHWANAQKNSQDQQSVWQSQPFFAENIGTEEIEVESELFYVY